MDHYLDSCSQFESIVVNVNELTTNASEPQTEESEHYVEQTFVCVLRTHSRAEVELQICTNSNPQISKVGINMEKKNN